MDPNTKHIKDNVYLEYLDQIVYLIFYFQFFYTRNWFLFSFVSVHDNAYKRKENEKKTGFNNSSQKLLNAIIYFWFLQKGMYETSAFWSDLSASFIQISKGRVFYNQV